jgi:hypothetical protein
MDHLDEAQENSRHLADRCEALTDAHERAVDKELDEALRHQQRKTELQTERLNKKVFILTVATTIFAPLQLLAGMYGMNFVHTDGTAAIPELTWKGGYFVFLLVALIYFLVTIPIAICIYRRIARAKERSSETESLGLATIATGISVHTEASGASPPIPFEWAQSQSPPSDAGRVLKLEEVDLEAQESYKAASSSTKNHTAAAPAPPAPAPRLEREPGAGDSDERKWDRREEVRAPPSPRSCLCLGWRRGRWGGGARRGSCCSGGYGQG